MANTIRIQLLRKRFEMLARDLGWRVADHSKPVKEWEGCYAFEDYAPYYIKRYVGDGGGETNVSGYLSTRKEVLSWIEGAECAVKAIHAALRKEDEARLLQMEADAAQQEHNAAS